MAGRLRAAMIDGFHGEGEVTNDLSKIHDPEATALVGPRLLNPWIKRQARPCSKSSESVRFFGLAWVCALGSVCRDPTPCDGVAAALLLGRLGVAPAWKVYGARSSGPLSW